MTRSNLTSFFLTLSMAFGGSQAFAQIDTQKRTIDDSFQSGYWIDTVDFDSDGDPDIVAASIKSGLKWYENDGIGGFTKHNISDTFLEAWSIHTNDIDGDGDMDVVAASALPKEVAWFRNNGDDTFTKRTVEDNYFETHGVFSGDVDNDGDIDLMAAVWENRDVVWWENDGSQNFTRRILDSDFNSPHAIWAADLDGDSDLDVIAGGGGKTAWWENNADGSFTKHQLGSFGAFGVFPVDLDGDNDLDILRNQRNNGDVDWFENDNATFTEQIVAAALGESWSQVAGDLDLDGDMDVVVAEYVPNRLTYWLNDGNQNFSEVVLDNNVTRPRCVNLADYDGDGDLDIAAVLTKNTKIVWYEVLGSPEPQLSLTLNSPNGGEVMEGGSTFLIEWDSAGDIPNVKLEYSPDNGQTWSDIIASTPNTGSLFWSVPSAVTDSGLVRISDVADPGIADVSDSVFSIVFSTLTVTSPNGGESWTGGDVQAITWTSSGLVDTVKLELSFDNGSSWNDIAVDVPNTGSYEWEVPDVQTDSALVRVSRAGAGTLADTSDAVFSIVGSTLTLSTPNGGETWATGATEVIAWSYSGNIDSVKIEYSLDHGASWTDVTPAVANVGSFDWTLPDVESDNAVVRVSDATDGLPTDVSDGVFSIASARLTLTAPNGGESLFVGSTYGITWTSVGMVNAVRLEYSNNAGLSWTEITASAPNTGSYDWIVPNVQTSIAVVRISDAADGAPLDVSDNVFSIYETALTLLAPNGGESWTGGSTQTIAWTGTVNLDYVNLEYSPDSGASWVTIANGVANSGSYAWTLPNVSTTAALLRISDSADGSPADVSDGVFSIIMTSLLLASPNGGESWQAGSTQNITWVSGGNIEQVSLLYAASPSSGTEIIASNLPNTGSYAWQVPDIQSDSVLVWVLDAADGDPQDESDGTFAIVKTTLTMTAPNGGETLLGGSFETLTWSSTGEIDSVFLEYSLNDGATWKPVAGMQENSGVYDWFVPNVLSISARLRVTSADSSIRDESDAIFSIVSSSLTVTQPNGGERWPSDSPGSITWHSTGIMQNVRLEYSTDGGANWQEIIAATPNDGSYEWDVPQIDSDSVRVRVSNTDGGFPMDESDALFSIMAVVSDVARLTSSVVPDEFALSQNYPNPFNLGTRIDFTVASSSPVTLRLFDIKGRFIRTLLDEQFTPGIYSVNWDGCDRHGSVMTSGLYVYQIRIGRWQASRRLVLVK